MMRNIQQTLDKIDILPNILGNKELYQKHAITQI